MALKIVDLYTKEPSILDGKSISQIIGFCGNGKLLNENEASKEFRTLLQHLPSDIIGKYIEECLQESFPQGGYALQDLVNQIGHRLGFSVDNGRYRGAKGIPGQDGLWRAKNGHALVVEIKTTDTYRVNLDVIAGYRQQLASENRIDLGKSSILIVTGRQDTGDLEAQVRGSRHAWDIRLISVDALKRLLHIKEDFADENTVAQISDLLKPIEYTRVDRLVDIIFAASTDLMSETLNAPVSVNPAEEGSSSISIEDGDPQQQVNPAKIRDECIRRLSSQMGISLLKEGRNRYQSAANNVRLICAVSKTYEMASEDRYWFSFHPSQREWLDAYDSSYVTFGCGSADAILVFPFREFEPLLANLQQTKDDAKSYWHVRISKSDGEYFLGQEIIGKKVNVTQHVLTNSDA